MFNFKRKPAKKLEDLRIEYNKLNVQHKRNMEAKQLEGKIWAMKHPMLANMGENMAASAKGKGKKKDNPWNALAGIDKRIIGK
jgi:hypothetical protein